LARLVGVNRNFDEKRLTGAVLLNMEKAFDTMWVKGLIFKLTIRNFPSYLVKNVSSYLDCRTFQTSFQSATSTYRGMRAGVTQSGLVSPVLFSLYVNDKPTRSCHVELAQYTALIATSHTPSLLVSYLETSQYTWHCLRDWRIAIDASKSTAVVSVKTARHIQRPDQSSFSKSQCSGSKQHIILG
jgi:hypothetical protein